MMPVGNEPIPITNHFRGLISHILVDLGQKIDLFSGRSL